VVFHFPCIFFFFQIDDVISQAQATRAVLGSQRTLFTDVQGKVKGLGDKFPMIRSLLGMLQFLSSSFPLIFRLASLCWPSMCFCRFDKKAAFKGYSYSVSSNCCLYVVSHHLLAFKVTKIFCNALWIMVLLSIEFFCLSVFFFFFFFFFFFRGRGFLVFFF